MLKPMLAHSYDDHKDYLSEPFIITPKLDGIRMVALSEKSTIVLKSRSNKEFMFLDAIRQELREVFHQFPNLVLDGEIYSHDFTFPQISSIVRQKTRRSPNDSKLQYWIFDVIDSSKTYQQRLEMLQQIQETEHIRIVPTQECNHSQVEEFHSHFVQQGYEGVMCRNIQSYYVPRRSRELLKYKKFQDDEFRIVGYKSGVGNDQDCVIFECETKCGKTFHVRPRGDVEKRKKMFKNALKMLNKPLTVRYFQLNEGVPRFPVGIEVRDYE